MTNQIIDVAIVGGGVSGVYTAWRLLTKEPGRDIAVFEDSDHIGGRLLSVQPPNISDMVAELGGMRILPAVQPRIAALLYALNSQLGPDDQIETYPFPVDEDVNIAFLRGTYLRLSDFTKDPKRVPYHLSWIEHGQTSGAIITNGIEQIVPGITDPGLSDDQRREMAQSAVFDGEPLYKQGFWNVLSRVISQEAYQLGIDAGGYETVLSNWNAADAIPWFLSDFGVSPVYRGFKKGFQIVPLTLQTLVENAGGRIVLNSRLVSFEWDPASSLFTLHIVGQDPIQARSLILAMPRRALELIDSSLLKDNRVQSLVKSVTPRPLFKIFTTYSNPWWTSAGVEAGRSVTDLPVRQTYYWPKDDGSPATSGRAMLMASYDDGQNIGYWDGYRDKRGRGWRSEADPVQARRLFSGADDQSRNDSTEWNNYPAPARMVQEVTRQLGLLHGLTYTPEVFSAAYRDWGDDPFGGGWNSWNIGAKSWEVKHEITQPYSEDTGGALPFYICGEAYSDAQGWVEGALQTADYVLEKLGIPPLPADPSVEREDPQGLTRLS